MSWTRKNQIMTSRQNTQIKLDTYLLLLDNVNKYYIIILIWERIKFILLTQFYAVACNADPYSVIYSKCHKMF